MQSALFNFHSFVTVVLLLICTCTYLTMHFPSLLIRRTGCAFIHTRLFGNIVATLTKGPFRFRDAGTISNLCPPPQ